MIHQRSHLSGLSDFEVRVQETGDYASASPAAGTRTATTAYAQLVFHHEDTAEPEPEPEPELKQHTTAPWKVQCRRVAAPSSRAALQTPTTSKRRTQGRRRGKKKRIEAPFVYG